MAKVTSFWLKNVVLFKQAEFKFTKGITYVVGRNLNRSTKASNASGKSLLFSPISNILVNSTPISTKNQRQAQKDIFSIKGWWVANNYLCRP